MTATSPSSRPSRTLVLLASLAAIATSSAAPRGQEAGNAANALPARFEWTASAALVGPADRPGDPCYSVKDPTVVRHGGRWHLFCTIRSEKRTHQVEYLSFDDWEDADTAERHVLRINEGYFCAPQVFYFT